MTKGSDLLVAALENEGVERIFGIPGEENLDVVESLRHSKIELVVTRQRKGKDVTDDVRPYLLDLAVVGPTDAGTEIDAHLATQPRGVRIGELIALLAPEGEEGRVRRLTQWMLLDGAQPFRQLHETFPARWSPRPKSLKRPWALTGCSRPSLARARSASGRYSRRQAASLRDTSAVGSEASTGMPMLMERETSRA